MTMDTSLYKEISYKIQGFRVVSWLIAAVSLLLCLLIGIGCYILIISMHGKEAFQDVPVTDEHITIVEGQVKEPLAQKAVQQIDFNDGVLKSDVEGVEPVAHLQHANKFLRSSAQEKEESQVASQPEIHPHNYKTSFSMRYPMVAESDITKSSDNSETFLKETLKLFDDFASQFADDDSKEEGGEEFVHQRLKRALGYGVFSYVPYLSYASFGKFLLNQVSEIAEYNIESRSFQSRKLGGDPEANFLDGYWPLPAQEPATRKTVKKSSADLTPSVAEGAQPQPQKQMQPQKSPQPTRHRWQPLVNQVPLTFVAEILRTLLNLMKEFLMKDHVMECLWFMFCQDVNHQAKYNDIYGILARVNSVGLKVLTESEQELRESDTFGEVWRSVTAWTPLQCDAMFPRCDGPKALEIVNEVALGSN